MFVPVLAVSLAMPAAAQQKQSISVNKTTADSRYTQEHIIDAGDVPGHQVRVYEISWTYKKGELAFDGVEVKEAWTRGMSDYTNGSGSATTYAIYVLEDGNKVFGKGTVNTQTTSTDGSKTLKFSAVENLVGGTGRFAAIRGQMLYTGSRVPGEKVLTLQGIGEYWIEK
jgi:hypothetical protein